MYVQRDRYKALVRPQPGIGQTKAEPRSEPRKWRVLSERKTKGERKSLRRIQCVRRNEVQITLPHAEKGQRERQREKMRKKESKQASKKAGKQASKIDRQKERQTERETDKETDRKRDRQTEVEWQTQLKKLGSRDKKEKYENI